MPPVVVSALVWLGVVILFGGLVIGLLWLKRGHQDPDTGPEWMILLILVGVAAAFLVIGVSLDLDQLPEALVQIGTAMIAGVVVGVVILVLGRRE